ncbi:hypothetical protein SLEP1_g56095 [Rubroshorea leprosula]|uniref:Uncharacterized protein n=1 Tax=Rubroshorea leprosula TaxID=152421 RepID=A0AAV5MII4_9ROSI|nr:hypothetical protein SLEP1_g56095 [Rubroshorea leprosula]
MHSFLSCLVSLEFGAVGPQSHARTESNQFMTLHNCTIASFFRG